MDLANIVGKKKTNSNEIGAEGSAFLGYSGFCL